MRHGRRRSSLLSMFQPIGRRALRWLERSVTLSCFGRKDRNSDDWYIGAVTDEEARQVEVSLDFLDKDRSYIAQVYRDGVDAHWKTNPYSIVIEATKVSSESTLKLTLAAGGGTAIRFKAEDTR